jgi:DNA mismatch repair protein MutS
MSVSVAAEIPPEAKEIQPLTPMMRQYLEVKALHPDAFLLFRLGDFYELFFEDAVEAAAILNITLTSRAKGSDRVPMCGVPYHSARRYIAKLIEAGRRVAICDQMEEPNGPGIVRREVTRIVTPGMVLDDELLESKEDHFLAAVAFAEGEVGAALVDASTGEFFALERSGVEGLAEELGRYDPKELVTSEADKDAPALARLVSLLPRQPAVSFLDRSAFEHSRAQALLKSHFKVASLDGFGLSGAEPATRAAGAALRYVHDTQKAAAAHIDRLSVVPGGGSLVLDEATRANLELVETMRDKGRRGSLLGVLDKTSTGMGARKLARWVLAPLTSLAEISSRQDAVEELFGRAAWREDLAAALAEVADVERLSARLSLGAGNARDLTALGKSLAAFPRLREPLGRFQAALLRLLLGPLTPLDDLGGELCRAVVDDPPHVLKEGGMVRAGYSAELDALVALSTSGKDVLLQIEQRERTRTGISSLKVRFNKVFGYYLEVTKANLDRVPPDYIRKQTTVGAERFVTPELKDYENKVLTAEEKRCALELEIFEALRAKVIARAGQIRAAAQAVATLDALISFARCAADYGYARPVVDDSGALEIVAGRHPVVERMLEGDRFVPNDVRLDCDSAQVLVITGPNMAGKSTVMRQVALIVLLAQAGSFVPAQRARIGAVDRIFTRVGAADNLARGQSTFMVEMTETAYILHHATAKSLVVLDEIGRGTSTFDGLSIAWAVAETLHDRVGARTLFATHYHELTDLAREKPRVVNCSIAVKETQGQVVFLRKLVPGGANRSYGIEVARLAGVPPEVLARAREILANLESGELDEAGRPTLVRKPRKAPDGQLALFEAPAVSGGQKTVLTELSALELDATTPIEALNALARWKKLLG